MKLQITNNNQYELTVINDIGLVIQWVNDNYKGCLFAHVGKGSQKTYQDAGKFFLVFLDGELKATSLEQYANHLKDLVESEKLPKSTASLRAQVARTIIKRTSHFRSDLLPPNIALKMNDFVKWTNTDKSNKRQGIHPTEIPKIIELIQSFEEPQRIEYLTMFHLLAYQGLRVSELIRLKGTHFDFMDKKIVKLLRKGGKEHNLNLFDSTIDMVQIYFNYFGIKNQRLFTYKEKHYNRSTLNRFWKEKIFNPLGLYNRTIHDFRHFLASMIAEKTNGNAYVIQDVLGHSNISTSQVYVDEHAKKKAFNELNKLM